jgi:hypothetical protein
VAILSMVIRGYYINGYWLLFYKWLLVATLLMVIDGYWCLLMVIILMAIGGYSIGGYQWLLIDIILVAIGGYLLMIIGDYFIISHWWLFY